MKLLKIDSNMGQFLSAEGVYVPIDRISKEDLLRLVDLALGKEDVEFDEYDEAAIKNQAHQIIYRSIVGKLLDLRERRMKFEDASARVFLEDYQKYKDSPPE